MSVTKIVITGGPCAGKSTAMSWVQNAFADLGYTVLFVPESATELITGGITPRTLDKNANFQKLILSHQLHKEAIFEQAAQCMPGDKILIVCDRGALDNRAYMSDAEFAEVLSDARQNEVELRDSYDAVFHLVTAAKGAEEYYTTANNAARTETVAEAVALDDKLIAAWTGHPHLRVIDNSDDFAGKMRRLVAEISAFLGEPQPYEIERKFLIDYPDIAWLESMPNCKKIEIIQTYLLDPDGGEIRVRQRGADGHYLYYLTAKRPVDGMKRIEVEQRLSKDEYLTRLMDADPTRKPIRKTRYCLTYENQYFEIDIYPFWQDRAIAEIELSDEATEIRFPPKLHVIKEVTDDESYKNASLAKLSS